MPATRETRKHPLEDRIPEETRQHFKAAREEMFKSVEGMLPAGFLEHRRNARREMLKAFRSLIDSHLEHMDSKKD